MDRAHSVAQEILAKATAFETRCPVVNARPLQLLSRIILTWCLAQEQGVFKNRIRTARLLVPPADGWCLRLILADRDDDIYITSRMAAENCIESVLRNAEWCKSVKRIDADLPNCFIGPLSAFFTAKHVADCPFPNRILLSRSSVEVMVSMSRFVDVPAWVARSHALDQDRSSPQRASASYDVIRFNGIDRLSTLASICYADVIATRAARGDDPMILRRWLLHGYMRTPDSAVTSAVDALHRPEPDTAVAEILQFLRYAVIILADPPVTDAVVAQRQSSVGWYIPSDCFHAPLCFNGGSDRHAVLNPAHARLELDAPFYESGRKACLLAIARSCSSTGESLEITDTSMVMLDRPVCFPRFMSLLTLNPGLFEPVCRLEDRGESNRPLSRVHRDLLARHPRMAESIPAVTRLVFIYLVTDSLPTFRVGELLADLLLSGVRARWATDATRFMAASCLANHRASLKVLDVRSPDALIAHPRIWDILARAGIRFNLNGGGVR